MKVQLLAKLGKGTIERILYVVLSSDNVLDEKLRNKSNLHFVIKHHRDTSQQLSELFLIYRKLVAVNFLS